MDGLVLDPIGKIFPNGRITGIPEFWDYRPLMD
jgi:hypothetical protein